MTVHLKAEELKKFGALHMLFDELRETDPAVDFASLDVVAEGLFDFICVAVVQEFLQKKGAVIRQFTFSKDLTVCPCISGYSFAREYVIPEGVQEIPSLAFYKLEAEKISIPRSIKFISEDSFEAASIQTICCSPHNPDFHVKDNRLYDSFLNKVLYQNQSEKRRLDAPEKGIVLPATGIPISARRFWQEKKEAFVRGTKQKTVFCTETGGTGTAEDVKKILCNGLMSLPYECCSLFSMRTEDPFYELTKYLRTGRFSEKHHWGFFTSDDLEREPVIFYEVPCLHPENAAGDRSDDGDSRESGECCDGSILTVTLTASSDYVELFIPHLGLYACFDGDERNHAVPFISWIVENYQVLMGEYEEYCRKDSDRYNLNRLERLLAYEKTRTIQDIVRERVESLIPLIRKYGFEHSITEKGLLIHKTAGGTVVELELLNDQLLFDDEEHLREKLEENVLRRF